MKKIFLSTFLLVSFSITADNHLPENFSKYQSNFLFKCDVPNKCLQAFNKYMESPEVSSQNFEADIFAILHNGWDDATHGIAFYYKDIFKRKDRFVKLVCQDCCEVVTAVSSSKARVLPLELTAGSEPL